jgi:hypothetical protein
MRAKSAGYPTGESGFPFDGVSLVRRRYVNPVDVGQILPNPYFGESSLFKGLSREKFRKIARRISFA